MTITYHPDLIQGSDEWLAARCGLLTASEMKLILTPTLKIANNEKEKTHLYELLAQRITQYVEPSYISDDMMRGLSDEVDARIAYDENFAQTTSCGFVTNDKWGFTIGCSPDALVGEDGAIECKSRRQKYQIETIVECVEAGEIPSEYVIQCQTILLVTERRWLDFVSYSGGLPMTPIPVAPDKIVQDAIVAAATAFEARLAEKLKTYQRVVADKARRLIPTERKIEQEMYVS